MHKFTEFKKDILIINIFIQHYLNKKATITLLSSLFNIISASLFLSAETLNTVKS